MTNKLIKTYQNDFAAIYYMITEAKSKVWQEVNSTQMFAYCATDFLMQLASPAGLSRTGQRLHWVSTLIDHIETEKNYDLLGAFA